jgi:hypothetical protein
MEDRLPASSKRPPQLRRSKDTTTHPHQPGPTQTPDELSRLRHRIETVGGSKDQWEAGVWHMDKEQWDLIWTGEQAFWKTVPHLLAAGHYTAEELTEPRRSSTGQPYKISRLMTAMRGSALKPC